MVYTLFNIRHSGIIWKMPTETPLSALENRLRYFLPAELYADMWGDPSVDMMVAVHKHMRTLHRVLQDYTSPRISINKPKPGDVKSEWQY